MSAFDELAKRPIAVAGPDEDAMAEVFAQLNTPGDSDADNVGKALSELAIKAAYGQNKQGSGGGYAAPAPSVNASAPVTDVTATLPTSPSIIDTLTANPLLAVVGLIGFGLVAKGIFSR